ncbi:hypothetical protein MN608_07438 [Microdochium nivale]|nr:hypothetical protein MN608_07438 [Microdochium nivale]
MTKITAPTELMIRLQGPAARTGDGHSRLWPPPKINNGPELPPILLDDELEHFRRLVLYRNHDNPIKNREDAQKRMLADSKDPDANLYLTAELMHMFELEDKRKATLDAHRITEAINCLEEVIDAASP